MVQVKVNEGILEGEKVKNEYGGEFFSFKGVPYAEPPIGDLRFKAPQPLKPWNGVRDAKECGPNCYQYDLIFKYPPSGSEDCLYLNIYTPQIKASKPLPVMVWIHGGGFVFGSGSDDFFGPEFLVQHEVVLVTINYRLEALGFLCLNTEEIPGNAGMKDQVAALRWVQTNIKNFGGDPENVTIFGESAGGASVSFHLISPMTKGLFKRAIAQSGASTCSWANAFEPRQRALALAKQLGYNSEDDQEITQFFKSVPIEKLVNLKVPLTFEEASKKKIFLSFGIVDEKKFGDNERFFYGDVIDTLKNGIHEGIEVMTGVTTDEGVVAFLGMALGAENYIQGRPIVSHGDDVAYLFPVKLMDLKVDQSSQTYKMIQSVTTLWTNFAKYGNPTPDNSLGVTWSQFSAEKQEYLDIGEELTPAFYPEQEELRFWENILQMYYPKMFV